MKRLTSLSFFGGALLAALPVGALVSGCGGGSGGLIGTPTSTPTTVPTATSTSLGSAPVTFGNGQTGTLNLSRTGNTVSGTLVVNAATQNVVRAPRAFSFNIVAGTYQVSGTVTASSFNISGNFPAPIGNFSINGTIPTTTSAGTYTITAAGQTVSGTYPKLGTGPIVTGSPIPTITTPPVGTGGSFSGTIASSSDANFGTAAFTPVTFGGTKATQGAITIFALTATEATPVDNHLRALTVTLSSANGFTKGQQISATAFTSATFPNVHVVPVTTGLVIGQAPSSWGNITVKSGKVTISDITSTSITLVMDNVQVVGDFGAAKGTLTINGTLKSNYTS